MRTQGFRLRNVFVCLIACGLLISSAASPAVAQPQFRAFWADVFHYGLQNAAQIDAMIAKAVQGNYNAILPEVLAYHDSEYGSHGAYWHSGIVARSTYASGAFDPLAYMVQQAHANGLELHPWLVAFRVSTTWPPPGNSYLAARPEWLMVPQASMGSVTDVGGAYTFDPGSPDVQEYLISIVTELAGNYEIDGIHWDYIRYTQTDAGYPADAGYAKSGLARFQQITGYAGTPAPSYGPWNDFRRRTIDELIRRCRAEVAAITSNPRQPLRHTAALIPWGDAPSDFTSSSAYGLFQNWESWMRLGYLDAGCPMLYFRDHDSSQYQWYRNWVNACLGWRYDRHMYLGQAAYLNTMPNSVTQLGYSLNQGADGVLTYSYGVTRSDSSDYDAWYPYAATNLFTGPAPTPPMPWRDSATATEGTLFGQITDSGTGQPVDDATVQVGGLSPVQTDGNGYYVTTLIPASAGGTDYSVTVSKTGYSDVTVPAVTVTAGDVSRHDLALGEPPCTGDPDCDDGVFCNGAETCDVVLGCQPGTDPCPGQLCDEGADACVDCLVDGDCDDALYCNGSETCVAGACQSGTPVDCDDGIGCTNDSCNETTDSCDNVTDDGLCDNGVFCDGAEVCDSALDCQPGSDPCPGLSCDEGADNCVDCLTSAECGDGLYCNGSETCVAGVCQAGAAVDCDDGVNCTIDSCDEGTDSCDNAADDGLCDNGLFCDGVEVCDPALDCQTGSDPCSGLSCDEAGDVCFDPACNTNGVCESGEDCNSCPADCFSGSGATCGNGVCDIADGEDCLSCPQDCNGKQVGASKRQFCCGDGDGVNPVGCEDDRCSFEALACTDVPAMPSCCGDAVCEGSEDNSNCEVDCGAAPFCGDGVCDAGENSCSCPDDCGAAPTSETVCIDGWDDDCDGLTDCADADCSSDPACADPCGDGTCDSGAGEDSCTCPEDCGMPPLSETDCSDGQDDDCDNLTDCSDSDCASDPTCDCLPRGDACTSDAECCSARCHRGACK